MSVNPRVPNITSITANEQTKTYNYDLIDRLVRYDNNSTDYQRFTYDANGNRLTLRGLTSDNNASALLSAGLTPSVSYSYTQNTNTLTGIKYYHTLDENTTNITKDINYTYDATGNIVDDGTHTYTYDSRNRLVAIDDNVTYEYNYDNKRVSKTVNGSTTYYIYEAHKLIGEYQEDGTVIKEYIYYNDTPIATTTDTETHKIYADHLDTPRRAADNTNNIVWEWESKPFGEDKPTGSYTLNLRFPGQYYDSETGTHYNINRDYNPITGRYIQSDPIGFDGGVNGFGYVGGNPLTLSDSSGLCVDPGGIGVRYCVDAFIEQYRIGAGAFYGDNRGSKSTSNGHDYRARVLIANYGFGYDFYPAIGISHDITGDSMAGSLDQWTSDSYGGIFTFYIETSNALAKAWRGVPDRIVPSVKLDITIEDSWFGTTVSGTRTRFPSLEIWKYTDSNAERLYYYNAGHWYDSPVWLGLEMVPL